MKYRILSLLILIIISMPAYAQKKAIKIEDYGRFRSISSAALSEKGNWVGYTYSTPRNDDTLYIKSISSTTSYLIPLANQVQFSDDEQWAAYRLVLPFKKQEALKKEKKPVSSSVVLLNLQTGKKDLIENPAKFEFNKGSNFLLVHLAKDDPKSKDKGRDLVLLDLKSGHTSRISHVTDYKINKPGTHTIITVEVPDSTGNGLFLMYSGSGMIKPLDTAKEIYSKAVWNEEGTVLAAYKGLTPKGKTHRSNSLISFSNLDGDIQVFKYDPAEDQSFPKDNIISENSTPGFSDDNSVYFFGIAKQENKKETKKDADPVANVDIWHWKDEKIQSVQKKQANRDKSFTYTSAVNSESKKFIPLADSTMKNISISRDGKVAIGRNDKPYISDWKPRLADYYWINTLSAEKKLIRKGLERAMGMSPDSKTFIFWEEGNFWSFTEGSDKALNITENTEVSFTNELFDRAGQKPAHGLAGWSKDGKSVLLYSMYDIWLQPLDGSPAKNLSSNYGTDNEIQLRYVSTDPEEKFIDTEKPMLLSAYGYWTKDAGFYQLADAKLKKLIYSANRYGRPIKAKKADSFLVTRESPSEYPDYYLTDSKFSKLNKISDANPIVNEFSWYHNELIEYTNKNGVRLQAVLMVPDGYKKGDKYPMLVDFYEKNSQNLNRWSRIIYRDTPMFPKYASNGYLVLLPDIHFNIGSTHSDMLECIEAAVNKVNELGYVDMDRIGIHGHSFSGQGGNYVVTHTDMFAAAVIGAGVSDLLADFNQLWKSSGTNQHRYDYYGQGRFNTNPYDNFDLFVDQSAVFHARNMNTPLLIFQGEEDGSVEWLQAVEFYNGLRFNNKNVILCSYPGEDHHLAKWENKVDFQTRMEQFYDHYLKGKPAPEWMIKGIPYLEKAANNN